MITPRAQRRLGASVETLPPFNPATVLTSHRALTGQRLSHKWRGTERTMDDQTDQTDPTQQYDQPEHTDEQQPHPGLTQTMQDSRTMARTPTAAVVGSPASER
jgi:hypothetical protein